MKLKQIFPLIILSLIPFSTSTSAQTTTVTEPGQRQPSDKPQSQAQRRSAQSELGLNTPAMENRPGQITVERSTVSPPLLSAGISTRKPSLTKDDIKAISIDPEDRSRFSGFLKQPKTDILRLHNADICLPSSLVISANGGCPNNLVGKASSYSFRTGDYTGKMFSDIFFDKTKLSSPGTFTLGIFSNLGDVDLDNLNLNTDGIKQLAEYQPSNEPSEIEKESKTLSTGIRIGEHIYKRETELKENSSYVLRTIAYKGKLFKSVGAHKFNVLKGDERIDITIVFRIVRIHNDGSITLLWKELDRRPAPKIVLQETSTTAKDKSQN